MNRDKTIRVGDRVKVKNTATGYGRTHIGRTAKVLKIEQRDLYGASLVSSRYRFGQLAPYEISTRYLVEMEGVRKEQVYASAVEKIHEVVPAVGDRVIVRAINNFPNRDSGAEGKVGTVSGTLAGDYFQVKLDEEPGLAPWIATDVQKVESVPDYEPANAAVGARVAVIRGDAVGRIGTVESIAEPYRIGGDIKSRVYRVKLADGRISAATKVASVPAEDIAPVKVGDRVKFIEGWVSGLSSPASGRYGTVRDIEIRDGRFRYTVDFGSGDAKLARKVELAPAPIPARSLSVGPAPKPAEPEIPVELPMKNLQAATFAHQLLGDDADLDKLIGIAEFVMDRRTVESPGLTGTVPIPELRTISAAPTVAPSSNDLVINDRDGDRFTVSHMGVGNTLAKVYIRRASDGVSHAAYLTADDVDAVIARLQAFKAQGFSQPF